MSQVSYGTITITDTNDIESIYMIYKGGDNNETPPSITWTEGQVDWTTDITTVEGDYIWAITVYKKSGITITADNYQEFFGDPVCLTGSTGRGVRSINTYYCNYGEGRPDETYNGWSGAIPEYDENKPNYWVKTVITYVDSTEEVIEASGVVANFNTEDKETSFRSLVADIDPIQDLNGYDKPWSGGAGVNLMPYPDEREVTINGVTIKSDGKGTVTLNGTCTATNYAIITVPAFTIPDGSVYKVAFLNTQAVSTVVFMNGSSVVDSWSLSSVNRESSYSAMSNKQCDRIRFNIDEGNTYNQKVSIMFVPQSTTVTAYIPYSNICPISGHTEVVTHRTGVNVWDEEWEVGTLDANGANISTANNIRSKNYIPVVNGATYYIKCDTLLMLAGYDTDKNFVRLYKFGSGGNSTFTIGEPNVQYIRFGTYGGTYGTTYNNDISINYPSTDTDYHAYDGETYTTSLGQTVYGGTLDVVSGELTIDRAMVDLGSLNWNMSSAGSRFYATITPPYSMRSDLVMLCSRYAFDGVGSSGQRGYYGENGTLRYYYTSAANAYEVYIRDDSCTSVSEFKTAVTGQTVCYELATPQTIQLTPQEVRTLLGQNNVWANSGEVSVSVFTTVGQDITIYKDNAITKAIHDSVEANAKATEALDKATAAEQLVTQVDTLLGGHFLWHGSALSTLTKAGARVVEQVTSGTTDVSGNPSQWLHNVNIGANGIQLRYNEAVMAQLAATNSSSSNDIALKFYQPPTIGSTTTQGNLTMALKGNALTFYDPTVANGQSVQATLDANGLKLLKGGIEGGSAASGNGYIYLSTENKGSVVSTLVPTPSGGTPKTNWRAVIGSKFGVDSEGNLYANNAKIKGTIEADSGYIAGGVTIGSGGTSFTQVESNITTAQNTANNASYSVAIEVTSIDYTANTATLIATPFYQGGDIPSGTTLTYTWYKDSIASANIVGSNSNTLNVTNTTAMGLNRVYICVISK